MDKKNLDKLFQEKLNNFSEAPDEKVWHQIEASLDQKKKRRVIPFWWQLGGVAALLIISFFLFNPFNTATENVPTVVETENAVDTNESSLKKNAIHESSNEHSDENSTKVAEHETIKPSKVSSSSKQKIVTTDVHAKFKQQKKTEYSSLPVKESTVVEVTPNVEKYTKFQKTPPPVEAITFEKNISSKTLGSNQEDSIAEKDMKSTQAEVIEENKKSIFDEIADQENEETEIANTNTTKWSVGPSVAPVFFDAIGEGSPVHSIFTANSKSGNYSMSYGLSVAYDINKRLRVRTGIHKVDYGYDTNDVEFSSSLESSSRTQINNINYTATSRNVLVSSSTSSNSIIGTSDLPEAADIQAITTASQNGIMSQQFGYLEVPIELEYALINSKFGVDVIGGLSSLFLVDNMILLSSENLTTELGEANNLNTMNFSANIGLGFNYTISKNIRLNLDPVFKYQLNTFSQTNGTFQPFSVGVYSGLSFRF